MLLQPRTKGFFLALLAALMWGISGACVQFLIRQRNINIEWLVTVRMLIAGTLLLLLAGFSFRINIFSIWKIKKDRNAILLFSIFGMLAAQYTYFAAINASNAATATVLQYMGPAVIVCFLAIKLRRLPNQIEIVAVLLTLSGTMLIVTHGSLQTLSISPMGVFWGVISAVALAFYTLLPVKLLENFDSSLVTGWSMVIGGITFSFVHAPWQISGNWDATTYMLTAFIILFASFLAFYIFMISVKLIGPTYTSLLCCTEPLASTFLAVVWLHVPLTLYDWTGTFLILITIVLLAFSQRKAEVL
jgi:drug/metabolite transporter (DMT)-like permease